MIHSTKSNNRRYEGIHARRVHRCLIESGSRRKNILRDLEGEGLTCQTDVGKGGYVLGGGEVYVKVQQLENVLDYLKRQSLHHVRATIRPCSCIKALLIMWFPRVSASLIVIRSLLSRRLLFVCCL